MAIDINIKGIADFNAAIDRLSKTLDRVETNLTTFLKTGSAIDRLFGSMNNFRDFTQVLGTVSKDSATIFRTLTKSMKELATAIASMPSTGNTSFVRDIKELVELTNTISVPAGGGRSPIAAIENLVKSLIRLNADIKAGASPRALIQFIRDFADVTTAISKVATQSNSLQDFDVFARALNRLATGLKSLVRTMSDIDSGLSGRAASSFVKIRVFIIAIGNIFEALNAATKNAAQEGGGLDQFSFVIDRLGRGLRGLDSLRGVSVGRIGQLTTFLSGLAVALRIVGKISGSQQNASTFATIVEKLFNALDKIGKLNVNTTLFKRRVFEIEAPLKSLVHTIFPLLQDLFRAAGRSGSSLTGLGETFEGLGTFFEKTSGLKFNAKNFKEFQAVVRNLVRGLDELERVRVDTRKLGAISNVLEQVRNANVKVQFQRAGFNLGTEIKKGLIRAGIGLLLTRLIFGPLRGAAPQQAAQAGQNIGNAFTTALSKGLRFVTGILNGLRNVGSQLRELGENLRQFGTNLAQTVGLGTLFGSDMVQSAIEFERLSTQVQVFGNLTEEQLVVAQEFADQIGIEYPLSANQAEEAMLNLLKAGLDLNETMRALPSAADLAALSDTGSIDTTSRILIQATQAFDQFNESTTASFDNAAVAADIIARAANNSTASVEGLGEALSNVGPVASNMGLTLEETVAIFGLFSDAGIQGAQAGTQLRSMLNGLIRPTAEVQGVFNELGVSLSDDMGNIRNFNDIINDLSSAMNDAHTVTVSANRAMSASDQERFDQAQRAYAVAIRNVNALRDGTSASAVAAGEDAEQFATRLGRFEQAAANAQAVISELSGSQEEAALITTEIERSQIENVRAIQQLAGTFGQVGLSVLLTEDEDAIRGFIDEMNRLPTAAEQAQLLLDNTAGSIEQLKGSFETLTKDVMLPLLRRAFRPFVEGLRLVVDVLNNASPVVKDFVSSFILFASTVATVIAGVSIAVGVLSSFAGIALPVISAISALVVAPGLAAAAIAGLVASLAGLVVVGTAIVGVLSLVALGITEFFTLVENNIGGAGDQLENFGRLVRQLVGNIGAFISAVKEAAGVLLFPQLREDQLRRGQQLALTIQLLNAKLAKFVTFSQQLAEFGRGFADFLSFGGRLEEFEAGLGDAFGSGAVRNINDFRDAFIRDHQLMLEAIGRNSITRALLGLDRSATPQEVVEFFGQLQVEVERFFTNIRQATGGLIGLLFGQEGSRQRLESAVSDLFAQLLTAIQRFGGVDLSQIIFSFESGNLGAGLRALATRLITQLSADILANRDQIVNALTSIFNFLLPGSFSIPSIATALGLDNIAEVANNVFGALNDAFRNLVNTIFDVLEGQTLDEALLGNFGPAVLPVIRLVRALGRAIDGIVGIFQNLFETLFPSGEGGGKTFFEIALDGIASAIEFLTDKVIDPLSRGEIPFLTETIRTAFGSIVAVIGSAVGVIVGFIQAIGKAFGDLISGKVSLGEFVGGIADGVVNAIKEFDPGQRILDLAAGLANFITTAISHVPDFIIGIGESLGSPLLVKIGEHLKNGTFPEAILGIAEGILKTVLSAIGSVPGRITTFVTDFVQPFFDRLAAVLTPENVAAQIVAIATAIKDIFLGALTLAGTLLGGLGSALTIPVLVELGNALAEADALEVFNVLVNALLGLIKRVFYAAGSLLSGLGVLIGDPILTSIGDSLKNMELGQAFSTLVSALAGIVSNAIKAVPGLLIDLGTLLGAPILVKLGEDLKEGKVGEALKTLVDGFVSIITTALGSIPQGLIDLGNFLGLDALVKIGESLKSAGWKEFADTLGRIATYAFDKAINFIDSVLAIVNALLSGNFNLSFTFQEWAGALAIVTTLNYSKIMAFLGSLAKFAKGFAIFEIVTATLDEFAEIARGEDVLDLSTFGDILTRIASSLLSLAGVELNPEEISGRIQRLFAVLNYRFTVGFREVSANINALVEAILLDLAEFAIRAQAQLDAISSLGADTSLREIQGFDLILSDPEAVGVNFFNQISQAIATSVNPHELAVILGSNVEQVKTEFNALVQSGAIEGMTPGEQAALIHVLLNTGSLDQILIQAPPGVGTRLLQSYLDLNPEAAALIEWGPILNQLQANAITQAQQLEAASMVQLLFTSGALTREEAQPILDGLKSDFDVLQGFIDTSGEVNPLMIPIEIGPQVSTGEEGGQQTLQQMVTDFLADQTAITPAATPFQLPVQIDPNAEFIQITSTQEEVEAAVQEAYDEAVKNGAFLPRLVVDSEVEIKPSSINMDAVDTAFDTVKTKAQETADKIDETTVSLQAYGTTTQDQTIASTIAWVAHGLVVVAQSLTMQLVINGVTLALQNMKLEVILTKDAVALATGEMITSFTNLALMTATPLETMLNRLRDIRDVTTGVVTALTDLGVLGVGGGGDVPGRRLGGPVKAGHPYQIIEDGLSELLTVGGRTYLIPGRDGRVDPLGASRQMSAPQPQVNRSNNYASNVNWTEGDIHITVQGGAGGGDGRALANTIGNRIEELRASDRADIRRQLILRGSTGV